jgi:DsbC/DsbD-like thiol-disulfide interchange protein
VKTPYKEVAMGRQVIGRRGVLLAAAAAVLIGGIAAVHAPREVAPERAQSGRRLQAADVVKVQAAAGKADGSKVPLTVTITVQEGWHIYANSQPAGSTCLPTTLQVMCGDRELASKLDYPRGREVRDEIGNCRIYEGRVVIKGVFDLAATTPPAAPGTIQASVHFQTCKGTTCLLPATVKVPVQ